MLKRLQSKKKDNIMYFSAHLLFVFVLFIQLLCLFVFLMYNQMIALANINHFLNRKTDYINLMTDDIKIKMIIIEKKLLIEKFGSENAISNRIENIKRIVCTIQCLNRIPFFRITIQKSTKKLVTFFKHLTEYIQSNETKNQMKLHHHSQLFTTIICRVLIEFS